jgi:hypothetical protein
MSHCRRTPHEDAGDTAVLAGAQSPPDGDQFPGVDPGSGYDGKHDRIEPQRRSSYSVGEGATELAVLHRWAAGASPSTGKRIVGVTREHPFVNPAGRSLSVTVTVQLMALAEPWPGFGIDGLAPGANLVLQAWQRGSAGDRSREPLLHAGLWRSRTLLREPLAGTTVQTFPGIPGHLSAWFSQVERMKPAL